MFQTLSRSHVFVYLVVVFILGAVWHLVLFKQLYASFGNYDALEKPRFEFGILSMLLQGIAFSMLYALVLKQQISQYDFMLIIFLILASFIVCAEVGKHSVKRLPMYLFISTIYCIIQTVLVAVAYSYI